MCGRGWWGGRRARQQCYAAASPVEGTVQRRQRLMPEGLPARYHAWEEGSVAFLVMFLPPLLLRELPVYVLPFSCPVHITVCLGLAGVGGVGPHPESAHLIFAAAWARTCRQPGAECPPRQCRRCRGEIARADAGVWTLHRYGRHPPSRAVSTTRHESSVASRPPSCSEARCLCRPPRWR